MGGKIIGIVRFIESAFQGVEGRQTNKKLLQNNREQKHDREKMKNSCSHKGTPLIFCECGIPDVKAHVVAACLRNLLSDLVKKTTKPDSEG